MQGKRKLLGVLALTGMLIWSAAPGVALGLGTDITKPESWVQVAPAANDNGWHKSDVTLNFFGYDGQTGLSKLEYKVNDGMWQTGNQCKVTAEGNHNIYFRAVDRSGNIETANSYLIKLDKTLPTVTIPVELNRAFRNTDVFTVDFNATDTLAGLDQVTTKLDNVVVSKGQVITLNNFAVGIHNLQVIAADRAGNRVTQNTQFGVTTTQDNSAPATIVGLPLANSNGWYKEPLKITFSAVDENGSSGVKAIEYRIDNGNWVKGYELLLSAEGRHTLAYRAVDLAGNVENARELIINLDTIKPSVKINIKEGTRSL